MAAQQDQLMRQSPLNRQQDVCVALESRSSFHGHYQQHVKQISRSLEQARTCDAVYDDASDITNLEWDISCVVLHCSVRKLVGDDCHF